VSILCNSLKRSSWLTMLMWKKGQSVGFRDAEGHTPLHWAAYQDHEGVARLLLSFGADIRSTDAEGLTPIHWAALKVPMNPT